MKLLAIAVVCSLTSLSLDLPAHAAQSHDSATQRSHSKITEKAARSIAAARYPNSAFESAELENENNRLIWSLDLRPNGSNKIQEVHIDAMTGDIITTEYETPQKEKDEAAEDQKTH